MLKSLLWPREAPQNNLTKISRTPPLDVQPSYPIDFQLRCNNWVHMSDKIYFENNLEVVLSTFNWHNWFSIKFILCFLLVLRLGIVLKKAAEKINWIRKQEKQEKQETQFLSSDWIEQTKTLLMKESLFE